MKEEKKNKSEKIIKIINYICIAVVSFLALFGLFSIKNSIVDAASAEDILPDDWVYEDLPNDYGLRYESILREGVIYSTQAGVDFFVVYENGNNISLPDYYYFDYGNFNYDTLELDSMPLTHWYSEGVISPIYIQEGQAKAFLMNAMVYDDISQELNLNQRYFSKMAVPNIWVIEQEIVSNDFLWSIKTVPYVQDNVSALVNNIYQEAMITYNLGRYEGYINGYNEGYIDGLEAAESDYLDVYNDAFNQGYLSGENKGYENGRKDGILVGNSNGYAEGYTDGKEYGLGYGETVGFNEGYTVGYDDGFDAGYIEGFESTEEGGAWATLFAALLAPFNLLSIELFNGVTIGMIVLIPIVFGLLAFIFKLGGKK